MSTLNVTKSPDPTTENISTPPKTYTYYHAGPLFTLAELHTNTLLANAISQLSSGKFIPILPQDLEQRDITPQAIRDTDIHALLSCDLALFTYDGTDLDAGTVVEYMVAKMGDVPAIILRTDFRSAGDQKGEGEPWNLMSSFWPRTRGVVVDAMAEYKAALAKVDGKGVKQGDVFMETVARRVVNAFEEVTKIPPRLPKELRESVYQWLALMPGLKDGTDQENVKRMLDLCGAKSEKGLL